MKFNFHGQRNKTFVSHNHTFTNETSSNITLKKKSSWIVHAFVSFFFIYSMMDMNIQFVDITQTKLYVIRVEQNVQNISKNLKKTVNIRIRYCTSTKSQQKR